MKPLSENTESTRRDGISHERRTVITRIALTLSAAALPIATTSAELCQDPEELSSTDYSFRKYVQYTEASTNKDETCSRCASFRPAADPNACGRCQAVAGSINPNGHCTGWSARK